MGWEKLLNSGSYRGVTLVVLYSAVLYVCRWLSYELRFDFVVPPPQSDQLAINWFWEIPLKLLVLLLFGQFSGLLSYFSIPDFRRVIYATGTACLLLYSLRFLPYPFLAPPRGVVLIDFVLSTVGVAGVRLGLRVIRERFLSDDGRPRRRVRRVAIIGAGDVGASLARELQSRRGLSLEPVVFFDDDRNKWRSRVHGVPVVGAPELLRRPDLNLQLEEAIIAMPTAPAKRIGEIVKLLQAAHLKFETVPSMDQLATGKVKVSRLRSVEIQDLLGREPVSLETDSIRDILKNRVVLVTGAGGSIGAELSRQIATFCPQRLLLLEQSEVAMFLIEQELIELGAGGVILPLIGDVLDRQRLRQIFARYRPEVIFHAAAHKHVPMMESQPGEAIKNNTLGTVQLAELALEFGIDRFVQISTDKAINPTNVMGATKRLAEIYLQALHASNSTKTKFMAVRFGNVLGSSGSVIPIFNRQIAAGGPVKVTHPEVMRFFMTIPEAVGLVLQSAAQGAGGEIFVLDMGKPVKIVELARQLIELSGLQPEVDIEIEFVGLRPGEKLFEELSHKAENVAPTNHPKILRFVCQPEPLDRVRSTLARLSTELNQAEPDQLKCLLKEAVPEYQPYLS
ncbi:MAG: polysaccharide biosynthesis protein [Verrucomicrobia bacterium]|nr:polysaccharide biosynthesis protein [Verrucomicrobiota bacterium]